MERIAAMGFAIPRLDMFGRNLWRKWGKKSLGDGFEEEGE